jgi:transposase
MAGHLGLQHAAGDSPRARPARALVQAHQALQTLNMQLTGPRPRRRSRQEVQHRLEAILRKYKVASYVNVELIEDQAHHFRQAKPGRLGPHTRYVRKTRTFWRVQWHIEERAIDYDRKSDGMYPLLTNACKLTDTQLLEAHKRQPSIEKRFEQTKSVFEIAPVLLKNEGRVEALFFVYFLALLVQALIERELRRAMQRQGVDSLFSLMQRHLLKYQGETVHTFEPELTDLQRQVLTLLGVPETVYRTVT